ncbi:hypothetical protein AT897_02000, partial [Campylobacter jejuni]|nr:hypothetical protein [Campylobacter jejuni]
KLILDKIRVFATNYIELYEEVFLKSTTYFENSWLFIKPDVVVNQVEFIQGDAHESETIG